MPAVLNGTRPKLGTITVYAGFQVRLNHCGGRPDWPGGGLCGPERGSQLLDFRQGRSAPEHCGGNCWAVKLIVKKQWKWAIGIVVFCILAPIVWAVTAESVRTHAMFSGAAVVSQFLGDLRSHDYPAAYALMAPSEQATISMAALQRGQEQIEKRKGRWLFAASPNEIHPNDALDHITYFDTVRVKPEDEMFVFVRLVRTDSGWRVLEFQYDDGPA